MVAGQATVGLELLRQCGTPPAAIFVPLGGGGLSAGIAISVKAEWPSTHVIACSPADSQVMIRSVEAGRLLDLPSLPTISDGTAGGVDTDAITFDLCRAWIDEFLTVSEEEIAESIVQVIESERILIAGRPRLPWLHIRRSRTDSHPRVWWSSSPGRTFHAAHCSMFYPDPHTIPESPEDIPADFCSA